MDISGAISPAAGMSTGCSFKHPPMGLCAEDGAAWGGSGCGEQRGHPRAAVPCSGNTEAVIPGAAPWSSAGWMEQGRDGSAVRARGGRDERGNHNCK